MATPIVFISQCQENEKNKWLDILQKSLPGETILNFDEIDKNSYDDIMVAIVANPDPLRVMELKNLCWIQSLWAGIEKMIDCLPLDAPPIVRMVDPCLSRNMAETVLTWCLYIQHDIPIYRSQQIEKNWNPLAIRRTSQTTVGILGMGEMGKTSAELLKLVGFKVVGWAKTSKKIAGVEIYQGEEGLSKLLQKSDIVVCLLPLTDETRNLLDKKRFSYFKKSAALINFARGPIVEAKAMLNALDNEKLSYAILDVFNVEPLPPTCPYWHHPKITVLPHIAAITDPESASLVVAKNISEWRKTGKLPKAVNRDRQY